MKKKLLICIFLLTLPLSAAHALDWAFPFVVWKGNVYEVQDNLPLDEDKIGESIGKVNSTVNQLTGNYYMNASNVYPIGTKYYEIHDIPTSEAIAVQVDDEWLEAVYAYKAPSHIMNIIGHPLFFMAAVIAIIVVIAKFARR